MGPRMMTHGSIDSANSIQLNQPWFVTSSIFNNSIQKIDDLEGSLGRAQAPTMRIFNPFPRHLALSRLKSNLFLLLVSLIFRTVFTPYLTIRRGVIWLLDDKMGITQMDRAVWLLGGLEPSNVTLSIG